MEVGYGPFMKTSLLPGLENSAYAASSKGLEAVIEIRALAALIFTTRCKGLAQAPSASKMDVFQTVTGGNEPPH